MSELKEVSRSKCFGGLQKVFEHCSRQLKCQMKFSIFLPSVVVNNVDKIKLPVVYFLSGLGSTEQDMITTSGIQRHAEKFKLIIVGPDTSPRGCNVLGDGGELDIITGAGFYIDATEEPWQKNYRMYSYVTEDLREVVERNFDCIDGSRAGITGHSMGGHGALVCFLRNPHLYKAVGAFAPISNSSKSAWGGKCMTNYLGTDKSTWADYDATELVKRQPQRNTTILVEQGSNDEWLSYLIPKNFVNACKEVGQPIQYNERHGYDHGYYFVATFLEEHMKHFADTLYSIQ